MLDFGKVWAVAKAETRLTRRLVRYWLFQGLAFLLGLVAYGYYAAIHYFISSQSATVSLITPRFLLAFLGIYYVLVLCIGLIFLAYDIRARDERERMSEVLDALPCSNVELLLGKFLGILIPSWIPAVVTAIVIVTIGLLIGESVQPISVLSFGIWMTLPAYAFTIGLTFLVQLIVRLRVVTFVLVIGILIAMVGINGFVFPLYMNAGFDLAGGLSIPFASDLTPRMIDLQGALQRIAYLLLGLGMLGLASAIHPRLDGGSKPRRLIVGGGIILLAVAILAGLVLQGRGVLQQRAAWKEVHAALREEAAPDIQSIRGDVDLRPGKSIGLDLQIAISGPVDGSLKQARFTFNPGLKVESIAADGAALPFTQKDGCVEVTLNRALTADDSLTLDWKAKGNIDNRFAYLDAAFDPLSLNLQDANVVLMGFEPSVMDRRFAALMPGVYWLPTSGAIPVKSDALSPNADFHELELTVTVPEGFRVAGPGRGRVDGNTVSFAPGAPVPGAALIAGRFASRSTEIDGIQVEILVDSKHVANVEFFAESWSEIETWARERLLEADAVGFGYPYDGLTLVETPGYLRGYGGGWRMGTTMYQPGLVLMRESGFPTARFDSRFKKAEDFEDREGGMPRAKWEALTGFFENDFTGGNPFLGASKNFFGFQTAGSGDDGVPLEFVCEDLSNRLVTEKAGYFSVHHFDSEMSDTINRSVTSIFTSEGKGLADTIIRSITSRADVWDRILGVGLANLEPRIDPKRALDVLTMKGGAMSRSMYDSLGRETSGQLMSKLRERSSGRVFNRTDVLEAGTEVGVDLKPWLDVWIDQTDLPGFTLRGAETQRIADSDQGGRRYQTRVLLQNNEAVPGILRVRYAAGATDDATDRGESDPVTVEGKSAVEIGIITSEIPESVVVEPYLSLNRGDFSVPLADPDEERIDEREPLIGAQSIEWKEPDLEGIVVDDLDAGFSVVDTASRPWWQFGGNDDEEATDGGLPISVLGTGAKARWSRREDADAFGVYRHTIALAAKGSGDRLAVFTAELPRAGSWELQYSLPEPSERTRRSRGDIHVRIVDGSGENEATLDSSNAEGGWNSLGLFEIAAGEVRVEVSNKTNGRYVIADAIRWIPAR